MNVLTLSKMTVVIALGLTLPACSTIVEGTDQQVTVITDPSGASCTLSREGSVIGVVNPTPGSIQVDKSKNAIAVRCEREGYQPTAGTLSSEFEGMTFGNILFGGLIGVAVDASSGAMNEYPPSITLILTPERPTPQAPPAQPPAGSTVVPTS